MALDLSNQLAANPGTLNYTNPGWLDTAFGNTAGALNTLAGSATTPGSIAYNTKNWNIDPATGQPAQLTGDWNPMLQAGAGAAVAGGQPGGYLQRATQATTNATTFDPAQLAKFLNPYTVDAATATTNLANKNLFESVLPQVNSSFTGAGQFGSTRNADFENRAIRDNQQAIANAVGGLNYNAVNNAENAARGWGQLGMQGAAQNAGFGNTNIGNLNTAGTNFLNWQNAGLGANYQDFLKQLQYPLDASGALAQLTSSLKGSAQPSQTMVPGSMTDFQKAMALSGLLNGTGTRGTGASGTSTGGLSGVLTSIGDLWNSIFSSPAPA